MGGRKNKGATPVAERLRKASYSDVVAEGRQDKAEAENPSDGRECGEKDT